MADDLKSNVGMDTTGFKTGVQQITAQMKSIETSFRASAAVMGDWSNTSTGLKDRMSSLTDKLNLQKQALGILKTEYDKVVASQGADSKAAASLANQMFSMEGKITSTNASLKKYDSQLKTVEKQEKENTSSLSKFKTGLVNLASQSQKSTSSISSHFGSLKGVIAGFATGLVSSLSLTSIISATDTASKTTAQMEAVLKSTGGAAGMTKEQLEQLATAQAKVTTYSAGTTKQAENMLLTFTNIKSNVFPQTVKAAEDMATAMKMDATDAAKTLGKALNDPTAGLSKLTKQGVTFTAAQKEQIKAMQAAGDTAGAQKIILAELNKEFGGSAEAAGKTLPGQIEIMKNSLKDAGVTIAKALMPIITDIMPSIVKGAQDIAKSVTDHKAEIQGAIQGISDVVKGIFNFIENHGPLIKGLIIGIGSAFMAYKVISGTIVAITGAMKLWKDATKAVTIVQAALNLVMDANPIALIIIGIAALVAAFILLWNNCEAFRNFWIGLWDGIKSVAGAVGGWFSGPFVDFFKGAWGGITGVFSAVGGWFSDRFSDAVNGVESVWSNVPGWFGGIRDGIAGAFSGIGDHIRDAFTSGLNFIRNLPGEALQWGKDIINGIVNGIKSAAYAVGDAVKGVAQDIKNFLHFSKPDEGPLADFDTYMPDMMNTMAQGITDNIGKLRSAARNAAFAISSGLSINASISGGYSGAAPASSSTTNYNQYGAQQEVTVLSIDGQNIVGAVKSKLSRTMQKDNTGVRGSLGYAI